MSLEGNILKVCGKALLPEEEEDERAEERPQPPQQQQQHPVQIQGEGQPAAAPAGEQRAESKQAELSGGEKAREQQGRVEESRPQERRPQRRFLIREFPSQQQRHTAASRRCSPLLIASAVSPLPVCSRSHRALSASAC